MNLLELNDDELKSFLEDGVPLELLRSIYVNSPNLASKLKGFRPNKAAKQILVNTSYSLIKTQKDARLIGFLTEFYDDNNKNIKESKKKYEEQGFSESMAMALAIEESINESFRLTYLKMENFEESKQVSIIESINILKLIKNVSSESIKESLKIELDNYNKNIDSQIKSLTESVVKLKKQVSEFKVLNESLTEDLKKIRNSINNLNNEELNRSIEEMNKKIDSSLKKERETNDKKIEKLVNKDIVMKLQDQIDYLKQYMESISTSKTSNTKNFIVNSVENAEYEEFDEYFSENVGDIIEEIVKDSEFEVLREYLTEIIFSKKPIIVSEKNSETLANIISSLITGSNYYEITAEDNCDFGQLILELSKLKCIANNKVVVLKNIINVQDYRRLLEYIKTRPHNEKYIFVISYDKELQFMAPEELEDFNFFIGKFETNKISYKYAYWFDNESIQPVVSSDFEKVLGALDINLEDKRIMNANYYGLLSYSLIPLKSIRDSVDAAELVKKIMDQSIRLKCEAVIHD